MDQTIEKEGVVILNHFGDKIYATHRLKLGMDQRREKEGVVILSHFDKIYATHILKLGMDQRREKEGVVILSHFDKIYATHILKLGMDQRREKEGVVILSHFDHRFMSLRNWDWKRRCDINSNAYKPREALCVRLKKLIFGLCDSFAGKLKALQEIQPAFQTQCALFSVIVKA